MFDGQNLPLHPAIFVPIYLALLLGGAILGASNPDVQLEASLVLAIFHGVWVWQSALYAMRVGSHRNDASRIAGRTRKLRRLAIILMIAMALSALLASFQNVPPAWLEIVVAPVVFGVFAFVWLAAKSIDEAEIAPGSRELVLEPLGTFLHLLYIFVGAFFVYRRLKKLIPA